MTVTQHVTPIQVVSADGTKIAVFVSGRGRPLVVLPGTTSDHTAWRFVAPLVEHQLSVHAVDRRGRGGSGDTATYSLEREYDDVAAVVAAAAESSGGPVDVFGHSFGGNIAFGAASRTDQIRRLVLYEGWPPPNPAHRVAEPRLLHALESMLERGQPGQMLETFLRELVHLSEEELRTVKAAPTWPARVAAAATVPREIRAFAAQVFEPAEAARIAMPVLLLVGTASPEDIKADPEVVAAALPDARIQHLEGQAHMAHVTDPESVAAALLGFLGDEES